MNDPFDTNEELHFDDDETYHVNDSDDTAFDVYRKKRDANRSKSDEETERITELNLSEVALDAAYEICVNVMMNTVTAKRCQLDGDHSAEFIDLLDTFLESNRILNSGVTGEYRDRAIAEKEKIDERIIEFSKTYLI